MSESIHPTNDLKKENYAVAGKLKFFDIIPPVDDVCIDDEGTTKSFSEYPIIPYAGKVQGTAHKMCFVLYNLKELSSTYAGVLNDFKTYALRGKFEIVKRQSSIFDIGDEQKVGEAEQRKFDEVVRENFVFHDCNLLELSDNLLDSDESTGQVGVVVIKKTILGKTTITYKYCEPMDYAFMREEPVGERVAISKKWDFQYLKKNPPLVVPLYPEWHEYKDGYQRTFYFKKRGTKLYGRPDDLSCLPDKYNEHKLKQYLTKKNKKLWMPDVFIETHDTKGGFVNDADAQDKGFANSKQRLEHNFTNVGDYASSFIITNRAHDSEPTQIHEFIGLKNSKEVMNYRQMFKEAILEANSWPKLLAEMNGATGFSTNIFMDVFTIKEITKIKEIQFRNAEMVNDLLQIGFEQINFKTDLGVRFNTPLKDLSNEYRNSKGNNQQQSSREGDVGEAKASV